MVGGGFYIARRPEGMIDKIDKDQRGETMLRKGAGRIATTLIVSLLGMTTVKAVEPVRIELLFEPSLENGKVVYEICASCHLPEGWGNADGTYPQLAGQHQNVLIKQLLDIRSGKRDNPQMYPFVQERTIGGYQSLADVVAYISTLPMTPEHDQGPWPENTSQYQKGKRLFQKNCAGCHGKKAEGNNGMYFPRLQGQHYSYLLRQAQMLKRRLREGNPAMLSALNQLDDDQLQWVLDYVSYIPVPKKDLAPSVDWRNPDFK
jgi:cytochrome c553